MGIDTTRRVRAARAGAGSSGGARRWRGLAALLVTLLLLSGLPLATPTVHAAAAAPVRGEELVVVPRSVAGASSLAQSLEARNGGQIQTIDVGLSGRVLLLHVPAGREDEFRARLAADPGVAAVSRNYEVHLDATALTPDDPSYPQQWGLSAVHAPAAWGDGARATGVTVAVIDSGADYGHPDLAASLVPGCNFVILPATCGPTAAADDNGHGTHVAGTIAALTNNEVGVAGLAWGGSVLPLKALDSTGTGSWYAIADAIGYATNQPGVRVINMSLGSDPGFPPDASEQALLQQMIDGARAKGIVVVAASGNSGVNLDTTPIYPASLAGVVAVTAVDQNGARPPWANYGAAVAVAAPGVGILSTLCAYNAQTQGCTHTYGTKSGTSMASPHVAALAALILARSPGLTPDGVAAVLKATATRLPDPTTGAGRIDAAAALVGRTLVLSATGPGSVSADPSASEVQPGGIVTLTATPQAGAIFAGWTIDGTFHGWASPLTLRMDVSHNVVGTFLPRVNFTDPTGNAAIDEAIAQLAARGIARGYGDGRYGPADPILRAQIAGLLIRAMGWQTETHPNPFSDQGPVDSDLWAAVGTLNYYRVALGYGDSTFHPLDDLLHVQAISVITRALVARSYWTEGATDNGTIYPNVPNASGHRLDLVTFVGHAGAVPDRPTANGAAWDDWDTPASRGWFALVLWQALNATFGVNTGP
jgi:subtilisin family serine protease